MTFSTSSNSPEIRSTRFRNDMLTATLFIPEDLCFFNGHFPGLPVLPGVAQIQFIVQLLGNHFSKPVTLTHLNRVKFLEPVAPGAEIRVEIVFGEPGTGSWRMMNRRGMISRGNLRFRTGVDE